MEIPVYLFTGFLEAGKTKFIQETLEDKEFDPKKKTLLLLCEEGEEEYDPARFAGKQIWIETVENEEDLTSSYLQSLYKKYKFERVLVEYNGMWQLNTLYDALPDKWLIYQEMMFADANTFIQYNANMRSLVVDKLSSTEIVIFNRYKDSIDKMALHKIVRGVSRRPNIAYDYTDGHVEYDEIEDPLPFDIDAPVIDIKDQDFALWYRDLVENPSNYEGKMVCFKGLVAFNKNMPADCYVIGRHVMTCCADDIAYQPLVVHSSHLRNLKDREWYILTAEVSMTFHPLYRDRGPVLTEISREASKAPKEPVATFY